MLLRRPSTWMRAAELRDIAGPHFHEENLLVWCQVM